MTNDLDTVLFGVVNLGTWDLWVMSEFGYKKTCGGWPGDAWSSNLLSSVSLVSNRIDIGPVHHGTVANGIAYPWL